MNVLLLTSHSIAEHDDLDMFTRMGVPTFSIGAYTNPHQPGDDKRPALPRATHYANLQAATDEWRAYLTATRGEPGHRIDWAKAVLAREVLEWADTIIVHHFPEAWIGEQWPAIRDKRVIWRTCGQSDPRLEQSMSRFRRDGLQIVRYSPRERVAFGSVFAGEDALIRFGKDPAEWGRWHGDVKAVGNITQHMAQRGDACGYAYWMAATDGLNVRPAGPGSEVLGGIGSLGFEAMREYLRMIGVYLYTGTRPASYTLGLIEALMTGVPVVSIGPGAFGGGNETLAALFEPLAVIHHDDPAQAGADLEFLLEDDRAAHDVSLAQRARAIELFGLEHVMGQWRSFLGLPDWFEPEASWDGLAA